MALRRTLWHVLFAELLKERGPANIRVIPELLLSTEPQRADFLLLRRTSRGRRRSQVLRALWKHLPERTIVEFKSIGRPLRRGDVSRLLAYAAQYHTLVRHEAVSVAQVAMLLVVADVTPTLDRELLNLGWSRTPLGGGYYELNSAPYRGWIVVVEEVAQAEHDDLLDLVGRRRMQTERSEQWLLDHTLRSPMRQQMAKLEGYRESIKKALQKLPPDLRLEGLTLKQRLKGISPQERLKGVPPEERLRGLKPEQRLKGVPAQERLKGIKPQERLKGIKPQERLKGLRAEEQILALSDEVLRGLSEDFIAQLPPKVRAQVRRRLRER